MPWPERGAVRRSVPGRWRWLDWQLLALGNRQLERHQVEVVHALGDRVLHLEPGVELQEVKLAIADQELDCASVHVADRLG